MMMETLTSSPISSRQNASPIERNNQLVSRTISRRFSQETYHDKEQRMFDTRSLTNLRTTDSFRPDIMRPDSNGSRRFHDYNYPLPSTEKEKRKQTKKSLSSVFGLCYEIFLVIFALCIFIGDALIDLGQVPQIFCISCIVLALVYLIFLYLRIRKFVSKAEREIESEIESDKQPDIADHKYCFVYGRHGQLYYLKIGAAVFCLGSVIHSILLLCYQFIFLWSDNPNYISCASKLTLILELLFPTYSLFVLFFLFKYANVIINEFRGMARIGIMHNIGTVLAMWVQTIVRETRDAMYIKEEEYNVINSSDTVVNTNKFEHEMPTTACHGADTLDTVFKNLSPYLYPFTIEFCIVTAGIFFMMWSNVGSCLKTLKAESEEGQKALDENGNECLDILPHNTSESAAGSETLSRTGSMPSLTHLAAQHEKNNRHGNIIYIDCHAANRGIFAAMILLVATIVVIILLFIIYDEENAHQSFLLHTTYSTITIGIMIITAIFAFIQTSKLDVSLHRISRLDDVLLLLSVPAFFANLVFTGVAALHEGAYLSFIDVVLSLIQVMIQTPWIIDGLRRCSNSFSNLKLKPGRGLVTFLLVANATRWIFFTFAIKESGKADMRYTFYGAQAWTILNHLTTPLIMFYRFHASVCLVDIWKHAYEPSSIH